jgi:hypothetical protein
MPAAAILVSMLIMLVVATPSDASPTCMTKTEAHRHFGSVHIYRHGQHYCWDATPNRRRQKGPDQAKWRDAMSEVLGNSEKPARTTTVQKPWVDRWVNIGPSELSPIASRWVDIAQVNSPPRIDNTPKPILPPHLMLLVMIALAISLTLATIEFLFRRTVSE